MRRSLVLFVLSVLFSIKAVAQDAPATVQSANCTQVLRLARAVYEQGRLHELETLLNDCLKGEVGTSNGFSTKQEKVDAYRLLCLSYIYLEEPDKADKAMLGLLNTDHFFALNPTDPAEFQALYSTFRTDPIFNWGFKVGANMNFASLMSVYSVSAGSPGNGKYGPGASFAAGAFLEKNFFDRKPETSVLRNTLLRADLAFMSRANKITYTAIQQFGTAPDYPSAIFDGKLASTWIDINVILRYRYNRSSLWDPYFGIGPGISYLLGAKINQAKLEYKRLQTNSQGEPTGIAASNSYSGPAIDVKSAYRPLPQSVTAVWGVNRRFGEFYINVEARFQFGVGNLVNAKKRYIPELDADYGVRLNDYRQSNLTVNAGITFPKFIPKKLTTKK